jgi:hypothetical protein
VELPPAGRDVGDRRQPRSAARGRERGRRDLVLDAPTLDAVDALLA